MTSVPLWNLVHPGSRQSIQPYPNEPPPTTGNVIGRTSPVSGNRTGPSTSSSSGGNVVVVVVDVDVDVDVEVDDVVELVDVDDVESVGSDDSVGTSSPKAVDVDVDGRRRRLDDVDVVDVHVVVAGADVVAAAVDDGEAAQARKSSTSG